MTDAHPRAAGARRYAVGWGLVALGLVAVVAMEAHGAAWSEHRGTGVHSLPHAVVVAGVVCAGLFAMALVVLLLTGARVVETPDQRRKRWASALTFLAIIALISIIRVLIHPSHPATKRDAPSATANPPPGEITGKNNPHTSDTWWPLVIVGLGSAAALMTAVVRRPIAGAPTDAGVDDATIAVLDASLDDLRREPDPRRAVIAAYARMERGLAARGFARQPWETPTEYLNRALGGGTAFRPPGVEALSELTALAERARFSSLEVDEAMRARAIASLETLRRELRESTGADPGRADLGRVG